MEYIIPDDEWEYIIYDRALQNTALVNKIMRSPLHVGLFRKVPTETKLLTTYYKQIYIRHSGHEHLCYVRIPLYKLHQNPMNYVDRV